MSVRNEINSLKESYDCNLVTFKEYYVLTRKYPHDDSYKQKFNDAKNNLIALSKNLFLLNNKLQLDIEEMKNDSNSLNEKLNSNQETTDSIQTELNFAESQIGGAKQLSEDYKVLYTQQYILNWSFVIGILGAGYITYRFFSQKELESNNLI